MKTLEIPCKVVPENILRIVNDGSTTLIGVGTASNSGDGTLLEEEDLEQLVSHLLGLLMSMKTHREMCKRMEEDREKEDDDIPF